MRTDQPMSGPDAVLWAMGRDPKLVSTVTGVALLDREPDSRRLRRRVEAAVEAFPRLQQGVSQPPGGVGRPHWVELRGFDVGRQLRFVDAAGRDLRWLLDAAASWDQVGGGGSRPLWELVVVEHLGPGGSAIVQRFHHSLTDGVGGVELLLSLLDWTRRPRREPVLAQAEALPVRSRSNAVVERAEEWSRVVLGLPQALVGAALHPRDTVSTGWRTGDSLAHLLTPARGRHSPLFKGCSTDRRFDAFEEPMEALGRAAAASGGTLNDVFLASVTGGLYRYHAKLGRHVNTLRINLPVSWRRSGDPRGGNRFTPLRFDLPVGEPDPGRRVRQLSTISSRRRNEPAVHLAAAVAEVIGRLPPVAVTPLMRSMLGGVDFVATNVPGVAKRCYIAGAEVVRQFSFAPLSGAAVNVALVSHTDTACIGVNMDRVAVSDPDLLIACLKESFEEVAALGG